MRTRIFLIVLALALVTLALAGWAVQAVRAAGRPLPGRSVRKETR